MKTTGGYTTGDSIRISGHEFMSFDVYPVYEDGLDFSNPLLLGFYISKDISVGGVENINNHYLIKIDKKLQGGNTVYDVSLVLNHPSIVEAFEQLLQKSGSVPLCYDGLFFYVPQDGLFTGAFSKVLPFWRWKNGNTS